MDMLPAAVVVAVEDASTLELVDQYTITTTIPIIIFACLYACFRV